MRLRFVLTFIIIFMFGQGCSVYMAANQPSKKDVSVFNVGTPRTHVIAEAGRPIHTKENADGTITDTFSFIQGYSSGRKAGRALFHGAADFFTLGLWEVVGTPVEAIADGTKVQVEVEYDTDEKVRNVIALAGGKELKGVDSSGAGKQVQQAATVTQPNESEGGQKLAAIPKEASIVRLSLRRQPMEISSQAQIRKMLVKYNFFDMTKNPQGFFVNDFADNNDGTVTDKATGLMWQKSGSSTRLNNRRANTYLERSNEEQFAGYSDWRMPTVEELASLLTRSTQGGIHLDPLFDDKQIRCWTVDQCDTNYENFSGAWLIDFKNGGISQAHWWKGRQGYGYGRYALNPENHVKAVRSAK